MTKPEDQYIIKLVGGLDEMSRYPELTDHFGRYVSDYQPQKAPKGEQWIWTTDDPDQALGFSDLKQLQEMYASSIGMRLWDGKPDRPITAFHVLVDTREHFKQGVVHGYAEQKP